MLFSIGVRKHVILLNGHCSAEEKYYAMLAFTSQDSFEDYSGCVFTSGVGSVGIDNPNINMVVYPSIPGSVHDLIQGMGRAGWQRNNGMECSVDVGVDMRGVCFIIKRNHHNLKDCQSRKINFDANFKRMVMDVILLVQLLCLNKGCVHARMANCVGNFYAPQIDLMAYTCHGSCPVCSGSFSSNFLPIDYTYVPLIFTKILATVGTMEVEKLVEELWADKDLICELF